MNNVIGKMMKAVGDQLPNTGRELSIFAYKDEKTGEFHPPFFQTTPQAAIRLFRTEVNRPGDNNLAYLYPEDYSLYYLGTFNQATGKIEPQNELLIKGPAVKNT